MLSVSDTAQQLGMSTRFVYRLCAMGLIEHMKLGGRIRIAAEAISTYLEGQKRGVGFSTGRAIQQTPRKRLTLSCLKLR